MGALYLLSATVVAALTLPSEPQIVTPESLPLPVNHSSSQPINLTSTARPEIWDGTGLERYRELLLPGIAAPKHLPDYHCDAEAFGSDLIPASCYEALEIMPNGVSTFTFGHGDADGHCAIEIRLKEDEWFTGADTATFLQLKEGAIAVFAGCLIKMRGGGVSRYQVEKYDPSNVLCGSRSTPGPVEGSCSRLVEHIYAWKTTYTFGRKGDEGVVMPLPYRARSYFPKGCLLTANTNGPTDRSSWYELFKAAVAVDMVCVRSTPSLVGIQVGIADLGEMPSSRSPSQPQIPAARESNVRLPLERRLSQSATSEDSQTVMIDTPSSLDASSPQSSSKEAPGTPQAQPSSSSQEPRKCWICFSDETEDTATSSEWISPCPCALQAHQTCLLDWIADLESPKRKKAKKIQCPQCKADIKVLQPHSLSIELVRAISRIAGRLVWPAAACAVGTMVTAGLFLHGAHTVSFLMNQQEYQRFMFPRGGRLPLRRALGIPLIPVILIVSRTHAGDSILAFLPMLYLMGKNLSPVALQGPDLWICALPALRSFYFAAYRKWALPREKAWLQEIQPRAGDNAEEDGAQPDQENADEEGGGGGGPLDMDFELGVQIEVDAIDEDGVGHHHHHLHHHHGHDHDLPQPNIQPPQPQTEAANPAPADAQNNNPDRDNQNPRPAAAAQPQRPPNRPIIQNFVFAIPDLVRVSLGALALPFVSYYMGQLLKATLPRSWVAPPPARYWNRAGGARGIMQSQTGRTVVGGCLFIVLKDSLFLYSKYSMAQNHRRRKVLNYSEVRKPWYRMNVEELMATWRRR
ncbi:MAG: hypothetical protein Q9195_008673 [Heterodermia aff. obscurata]